MNTRSGRAVVGPSARHGSSEGKNIFTKGALVALATTAVLVGTVASSADAAVYIQTDGTSHVDKADVKAAFRWTNDEFDRRVNGLTFGLGNLTFRAHFERTCNGENFAGTLTITVPRTVAATVLMSQNGRQVTGWDLTPSRGTQVDVDDNYWNARAGFNTCAEQGGVLGEDHSSSGQTVDNTLTVTSDGVSKVLTPTPVV